MNSFLGESPLQHALRNGKTPAMLTAELGLAVRRHPKYPNLMLFNYDQIKSPKTDPIVGSARGCILDEANDWAYVCRPFDRFFNLGEAQNVAVLPDPASAFVYTKEDGSLLNMWWYQAPGEADGAWHVSTRNSPDASGTLGDFGFTLAELFWRVWRDRWRQLDEDLARSAFEMQPHARCRGITFMFELCTRWNKIIVPQEQERLILLGLRDNVRGSEYNPQMFGGLPFDTPSLGLPFYTPKTHKFKTFDAMQRSFLDLPARYNEGYVVAEYMADGSVRRCKVKHPGYVALAHLGEEGGVTRRRILELVRSGEDGEFLAVSPEYTDLFQALRVAYATLLERLEATWTHVAGIENQKDYALAVRDGPMPGVLFAKRKTNDPFPVILARTDLDVLLRELDKIMADGGAATSEAGP